MMPWTLPLAVALLLPTIPRATPSQEGPTGTVIVANMDAGTVWFVDAATGDRRGLVETRSAPHEVAVSNDGRLVAITNYGGQQAVGNVVQIADVAGARLVRELTIEGFERLHGVAFLPGDSLLVLTSERTGEILVVSASDGRLRRKVPTGGRASHMLARGGRWLWVANIVDGSIARVDPSGREETRTWPVGATRTEGVAAAPDGSEGWTGSMESGVVVGMDAEGNEVARVGGLQVPYRLAVTPDGTTVVVSDPPAAALVLIDRRRGTVAARVDVGSAAREAGLGGESSPQGFTLSADGRWAFLSTQGLDRVVVVDLRSRAVVGFLEAGAGPDGIAHSPVTG
jgi:DNA-binding beta-propeller fold protein YncE